MMIVSQNTFACECLGQFHQKQVKMEPLKQANHPKYWRPNTLSSYITVLCVGNDVILSIKHSKRHLS